jgi:hypothetical protein
VQGSLPGAQHAKGGQHQHLDAAIVAAGRFRKLCSMNAAGCHGMSSKRMLANFDRGTLAMARMMKRSAQIMCPNKFVDMDYWKNSEKSHGDVQD